MKSDLSRDTFDRARHFSSVRLQQGRVVTDADWNESADLVRHRAELAARDIIGACGTPVEAAGYSLAAETNALSVHALNANVIWIGAEDGALLRTTNGGADWTRVDLDTTANIRALAEVGGTGWAVGDRGVVRKTNNQGSSWIPQNSGTLRTLRGVSVFDSDHAWAVGDGGVVIATSDGGANWRVVQTEAARLHAVRFTDEFAGLAAGQGGAILATSDGGQTWVNRNSGSSAHLRALAVFGTTLAWAAGKGGTILRSTDGGGTWLQCNSPAGSTIYAIAFRDANEGWAAGESGLVLHSTDGGANWSIENAGTSAHLRALSTFGADPGWLVGDGSTALRIGGGSPDLADVVLPAVNLSIGPGRCYVNGTLCELEERTSLAHQPDGGPTERLGAGAWLLYLDVWQRHISALEEPSIREVALGGPDTATRSRTIAQVRALSLPPSSPFDWTCSSTLAGWDALANEERPLLAARAEPQQASANLCEIAATAGYRRLENQLYRVEIHESGATPTFKWSRENGSVAYAVLSVSVDAALQRTTVKVAARGRDANLDAGVHDRLELIDDEAELLHRSGTILEYLNDGDDEFELVLAGVPDGSLGQDPTRHPVLRRWDHKPSVAGANVLPVTEGVWIELEDGVQVRFGAGGVYRPGDYWQIPARTITANAEWPLNEDGDPVARPPAGTADAYCRLGIVEVDSDGVITVVADCREPFAPLTSADELLYVSGDGQEGAPNARVAEPLAVRVARGGLPVSGRAVRFQIESGGGRVGGGGGSSIDVITDQDGIAWCDWQLGPGVSAPGRFQRVQACLLDGAGQPLPGQRVVFCASTSLLLRYVSGDGQNAAAGSALPFPVEVQVVSGSDGIAGVLVRATVEQGGGTIAGASTRTTDGQGQAAFRWQLGTAGAQRVRVELIDGTGRPVQRLAFNAGFGTGGSRTTRGCDLTIGSGGDFEELTIEVLRQVLEQGRGAVCVCLLPGQHNLPELEVDGQGRSRLSLHGCGRASQVGLRGPLVFRDFNSVELRDLALRAEGDSRILFEKDEDVRIANVFFDRSAGASRVAAVNVVGAQTVSVTGCEIVTQPPSMAAMFQDIESVCRVLQNRFVGIVSFYGETEEPPTAGLMRTLAARENLRLSPGAGQLSFANNELSQLSVATSMARRLATRTGTASGVFRSAVIHGNTFTEQNSVFVAGLLGVNTNAFVAQPAADSVYGVMLALRATATGNLGVVPADRPLLHFVVPGRSDFDKAANEVPIAP